jgi:MFS family permease
LNAFGDYQAFYQSTLLSDQTESNIAWIGSIQGFLLLFFSVFAGPAYDKGYFYPLIYTGSFMIVFGYMMTSLCTEYYQIILAQGVCIGIGNGLIFIPSIAILSQYFTTKLPQVNGMAACGGSVGGILYPIVLKVLIPAVGFGWSTRILGFITLCTSLLAISILRLRQKPTAIRAFIQLSAFKEPKYVLYCAASFLAMISWYGPLTYLGLDAQQYDVTTNLSFFLLPILNSASILGRLGLPFLVPVMGPLAADILVAFVAGFLLYFWIAMKTAASLTLFAVLYGFFWGGIIAITPVVVIALTPNPAELGTRMGMSFGIGSFGLLIGTPVAGAILGNDKKGWVGLQVFFATCLTGAGAIILAILLISKMEKTRARK